MEAFYPRHNSDAHLEASDPLFVWTGAATQPGNLRGALSTPYGAYFTFGDLVGAYGDVYRTITCDERDRDDCRFGDNAVHFQTGRRAAIRDLLAGKRIFSSGAFALAGMKPDKTFGNFNRDGENTDDALVSQELRLAFTNANHFGTTSLRWYAANHRQALYYMARAAEAFNRGDTANADKFFRVGMHYEATACHSLTDLFAPGHIVTNRDLSSDKILENQGAKRREFDVWQDHMLQTARKDMDVNPVRHPGADDIYKGAGVYTPLAKAEESLHSDFNQGGARVRNLKTILATQARHAGANSRVPGEVRAYQQNSFRALHQHIQVDANDGSWRAFGDKDLFFYGNQQKKDGSSPIARVNGGHAEWGAAAVEDSLVALFDVYLLLKQLPRTATSRDYDTHATEHSRHPKFWEALADIPLEVHNLCMTRGFGAVAYCFAPPTKAPGRSYLYVPYKDLILAYLDVPRNLVPQDGVCPSCTANRLIDPTGWKCTSEPVSEAFGDTERHFAIEDAKKAILAINPNARFAEDGALLEDDVEPVTAAATTTNVKSMSQATALRAEAATIAEHARALADAHSISTVRHNRHSE